MTPMFVCKHCHKLKPANPHLKGTQQYCSDPPCQRARKAAWQKEKIIHDPEYRAQQRDSLRTWRKQRPLDQYQRQYRLTHPDYVKRNRELQRLRNKKQSERLDVQKIVKMDALIKPTEKSNAYLMRPYHLDASGKIVKMDALIVQLTQFQSDIRPVLPVFP